MLGVRRHFEVVAHLEDPKPYGQRTVGLNWPDLPVHPGPRENWPLERYRGVEAVFANPPCFTGNTRVLTIAGWKRIDELVRDRSTLEVMSVSEDGACVTRPITGWHENRYDGDLYDVTFVGGSVKWDRGIRRASSTEDHRFLTRRGWIRAADLTTDDEVCTGKPAPNDRQRELITGMMLGDGTIKKQQAQLRVFQATPEYVKLKRDALGDLVCGDFHETAGTACGPFTRKPRHGFYLKTQAWVERERDRWYTPDRRRIIPADLKLTPLTLAVWYMDDGTLRSLTQEMSGGTAHLCTDRFAPEDVERLIRILNDAGIVARRVGYGSTTGPGSREEGRAAKYPRILITASGFKTFMNLIGPYVLPEMRYKLPAWAPPFDPSLWELGSPTVDWDRVRTRCVRRSKNPTKVYCLDVAETHNFVTYGGVVHNCAIFSTMGAVTTRGRDAWRTDPRLGCWYDSFSVLDAVRPRAWVLESVCQAYTRGREVVDELTRRGLTLGYSVTHLLHDARWCGVPQRRRRFFLIMHRPRHLRGWQLNFSPPPTVGDALAGVAQPGYHKSWNRPDWDRLIAETEPGGRLCQTYERLNPGCRDVRNPNGTVKGRPSFQERRLSLDEPMGAWIGDKFYHPTETRAMGVEEAKALCGFPPDFRVAPEDLRGFASLLARGVMPPVGDWIARAIAATLGDADVDRRDQLTVTLIDVREPGIAPVDLTARYLNERGLVRYRVRADGLGAPPAAVPVVPDVPAVPAPRPLPRPRVPALAPVPAPAPTPPLGDEARPLPGEGSGALIRRLWLTGRYAPERLVEIVHANWNGRTTTVGDVRFNYYKLIKDGVPNVPPWPTARRTENRRSTLRAKPEPEPEPEPDPDSVDDPESAGPAPMINRGIGPRIAMTGCTRSQASERNLPITGNVPLAIARAMRDLGADVDWRPGELGVSRRDVDAAFVILGAVLSIPGCYHAATALWTIAEATAAGKPVMIMYDDWQIRVMRRQIGYVADRFDGPVYRRFTEWARNDGATLRRVRDDLRSVAERLVQGWDPGWTAIFPLFRNWGDRSLVTSLVPAARYATVDPTPALIDGSWKPAAGIIPKREWFLPALARWDSWVNSLPATWPITRVGHRSFGPKLPTRADVMRAGAERWGTLCPPYDHAGSGWFRSRYLDAALAGRVLLVDPADAAPLGDAYGRTIPEIEGMLDVDLTSLAEAQADIMRELAVFDPVELQRDVAAMTGGLLEVPERELAA